MSLIHENLEYKDFPVPEDIELPPETGYNPYDVVPDEEDSLFPDEEYYEPSDENEYEYPTSAGWYLPWLDEPDEDTYISPADIPEEPIPDEEPITDEDPIQDYEDTDSYGDSDWETPPEWMQEFFEEN